MDTCKSPKILFSKKKGAITTMYLVEIFFFSLFLSKKAENQPLKGGEK